MAQGRKILQRSGSLSLQDGISRMLSANKPLCEQLCCNAVFEAWEAVSGVGRYTSGKFLRDSVLYVTISSSVLRSRLMLQSDAYVKSINAHVRQNHPLLNGIFKEVDKIVMK